MHLYFRCFPPAFHALQSSFLLRHHCLEHKADILVLYCKSNLFSLRSIALIRLRRCSIGLQTHSHTDCNMPPPKTKNNASRVINKSRFCEGSMSDRTSVIPPVHFLGPDEKAALERPVPVATDDAPTREKSQLQTFSRRSGTRLLAQAWEGVRGRLRLRKEHVPQQQQQQEQQQDKTEDERLFSAWTAGFGSAAAAAQANETERPQTSHGDTPSSRTRSKRAAKKASQPNLAASAYADADDVLASYKQLISEGFFKANAIHSTRVPAPGPPPGVPPPPAPTQQQRDQLVPKPRKVTAGSIATVSAPPAWPLAQAPVTPTVVRVPSAMRSPASASSRGTKRAMDDDDSADEDEGMEGQDEIGSPIRIKDTPPKRKLRKTTSSDVVLVPKMRRAGRRSVSASNSSGSQPNKLTKRAPTPHRPGSLIRGVGDSLGLGGSMRSRGRDDGARPMSVVPDANRGIPSVPALPAKFTYGEDRENNGPWRGLRLR